MSRPDAPKQLPLEHPPLELISERPVREAVEKHGELLTEYQTTVRRRQALERTRQQAVLADRNAYATAIAEGKEDPGQPATRERDAEITETARREEALEVAVTRAREAELEAIARAAPKLRAHARKTAEKERRALLEAIDQVAEHRLRLAEAVELENWTATAPQEGYARWTPQTRISRVPGLLTRASEPFHVIEVLDALRGLAVPFPVHSEAA